MQTISTNNLFMHRHEKWHCLPPPLKKVRGQLPPAVPWSMLWGLKQHVALFANKHSKMPQFNDYQCVECLTDIKSRIAESQGGINYEKHQRQS